jgi:hypothetical protein
MIYSVEGECHIAGVKGRNDRGLVPQGHTVTE